MRRGVRTCLSFVHAWTGTVRATLKSVLREGNYLREQFR